MKKKKFMKKASILLIAAVLVFSTITASANTTNDKEKSVNISSECTNENFEEKSPIVSDYQPLAKGIIWDNGDVDEETGVCCQRIGSVTLSDIADDFHLDEEYIITGAVWETVDDETYDWGGIDDMIIYQYTGSGPGAEIKILEDVPNTRVQVGELFSRPWYRYTIDLVEIGEEFTLPAGDYYILLRPVTYGTVGQSFWLSSPGSPSSQSQIYFRSEYFGHPDWIPSVDEWGVEYDVNFKLLGESQKAELEIGDTTGGFGISTSVKNVGTVPAENVMWEVKLEGGFILSPAGGVKTGGPLNIAVGGEQPISVIAFGFGGLILPLNVIVTATADNADPVSATFTGKLILIFADIS